MNTHAKHSYVPATTKLKAALTSKDKLPVLRSTGSYTPSTKCARLTSESGHLCHCAL